MTEHDTFERRFDAAMRGYAARISSDLDPVELARRIVAAEPRRAGFGARVATAYGAVPLARQFAWLILLALLLAAVGAAALFLGTQQPRWRVLRDIALAPSGIEVLTVETSEYSQTVIDRDGIVWARAWGERLVMFDPATATGRSWTISDDAAFAVSAIAPAHAGGVWLVTGQTVRRFDGSLFREVIEAPAAIAVLTEAPDATLWAGSSDGRVLHWDGSSWATLDPPGPTADAAINAITVDTTGRTWVGWLVGAPPPQQPGWVSVFDGHAWTRLDGTVASPLGGGVWSITELADGSVWVATDRGIARFKGSSWTDETPADAPGGAWSSVAMASDGTIWATTDDTDSEASISVGHRDGASWTWYGTAEGLPVDAGCYIASVLPTRHGLFLGTCVGLYRLSNDRWEPAWPPPAVSGPAWLGVLLAVSRDELWAAWRGDNGLWHYLNGGWTYEEIVPEPTAAPAFMTRARDGTLWAGGSDGVAYRRDGRWIVADPAPASALAIDPGGTVWVAGTDTWRTMRLGKGPELWTLRFDGTAWTKQAVEDCPLQSLGMPVRSLGFDATGALWVGIPNGYEIGGLARFDGTRWEVIGQIGGRAIEGALILGRDAAGGLWIEGQYRDRPPGGVISSLFRAARFDGTGWTVVEMPDGESVRPVLGADGTLWASTPRGPARRDGQRWTFPYRLALLGAGRVTVAGDGTVFGGMGSSLLRFPPLPTP